jgi:hypothetical protein
MRWKYRMPGNTIGSQGIRKHTLIREGSQHRPSPKMTVMGSAMNNSAFAEIHSTSATARSDFDM